MFEGSPTVINKKNKSAAMRTTSYRIWVTSNDELSGYVPVGDQRNLNALRSR